MSIPHSEPHLLVERNGHILTLTMNRPQARNALSPEMCCRLADAYINFSMDDNLRVMVLTGAGEHAFCAGGDLALTLPLLTGARLPENDWDHKILQEPKIMNISVLRYFDIDKPIIAAINGACLAGGMETMLASDIRISSHNAKFGLPESKRGLIPFAGSLARLPRQLPHAVAMELLLTGDLIDAERAYHLGLINQITEPRNVLPLAMEMAERIAANAPIALREIKRTTRLASGASLAEGFALEDEAKAIVMATRDAREGPQAFMEKRPARYLGQ